MCFGGGDDSSSKEMIKMQKEEAAAARKKEKERQDRINKGLAKIKGLFHGGEKIMKKGTKAFDWKTAFKPPEASKRGNAANAMEAVFGPNAISDTFRGLDKNQPVASAAVAGLPTGFKYIQVNDPAWKAPAPGKPAAGGAPTTGGGAATGGGGLRPGQQVSGTAFYSKDSPGHDSSPTTYIDTSPTKNRTNLVRVDTQQPVTHGGSPTYTVAGGAGGAGAAGPSKVWAIQGPDGKIYYQGDNINYSAMVDTGKVTDDPFAKFYDTYRNSILNYYRPQIAKEYGKAQEETLYRLARAGTTKSTAANTAFADLKGQNKEQGEKLQSQADTATGELKSRVASEEQKAINQLYATENPDVAANTAIASVKNISAEKPELSPLANIFDVATIGTAGALQGYQNQKYRNMIPGTQQSTTIV